jgi:hypothetical protein
LSQFLRWSWWAAKAKVLAPAAGLDPILLLPRASSAAMPCFAAVIWVKCFRRDRPLRPMSREASKHEPPTEADQPRCVAKAGGITPIQPVGPYVRARSTDPKNAPPGKDRNREFL